MSLSHISSNDVTQEQSRCRQCTDSELIMLALAELLKVIPDNLTTARTVALQGLLMERAS